MDDLKIKKQNEPTRTPEQPPAVPLTRSIANEYGFSFIFK